MAGTVIKYGRPVTGPEVDIGWIGNGFQRACVYDAHPGNVIVYALGGWLGEWEGGTPYARLFMASVSNGAPGNLLAQTVEFQPSKVYSDITGGDDYVYNVTPFIHGPTPFALGYAARNGKVSHSMRAAVGVSQSNKNFYDRESAGGTTPRNPVGGTGTTQGHMSVWFVSEENVAPDLPTGLGVTNSLSPVFTSFFNDANKVLNNGQAFDYATQVNVRVLEGATVRWDDSYTPTAGSHSHSRTYAGSHQLQYYTTYTYQVRHRDRGGLWSSYASMAFTITPPNTRPNDPGHLQPSGTITGGDLTPLLTSTFSDPEEVLSTGQLWDRLEKYQIKVTRAADGVTMWAPAEFTASSTERANDATSREYAGSTLTYGVDYRYQIRHQDRGGLWSNWASTTFRLTALSSVDAPSSPTGLRTNAANPGDIAATYRHGGGKSANAFRARLLSETGTVLATSGDIAKSVAPNANVTILWSETGFGTLSLGTGYNVQLLARDVDGVWASSWSPSVTFRINAPPLVPSGLSPSGMSAMGTRPRLVALASDPDPQHPTSGLVVTARIKDGDGVVLQTRTMTWNSASQRFEYQTTAADLPAFGDYRWDAYSYDGAHYSGGATSAASATASDEAFFVYAAVPTVTLTGPAATITTVTPVATWTSSFTAGATQASYRVRLLHPTTNATVYDSGVIASASQSSTISASTGWIGGERWNNGETFKLRVTIVDSNGLSGSSADLLVTLTLPAVQQVAYTSSAIALPGTHGTNAIQLNVNASTYSPSVFEEVVIVRSELVGDSDVVRPGGTVRLKSVDTPAAFTFIDADVTSRQRYRYEVFQRISSGNDIVASDPSYRVAFASWDGVVIHAPLDPTTSAVSMEYGSLGQNYDPSMSVSQPHRIDTPISAGGRVAHFGRGMYSEAGGEFALANDAWASAEDRLRAILYLMDLQAGEIDNRPHVLCWREGRGGPLGRIYGIISGEPTVRLAFGGILNVSIQFTRLRHVVGEADS